MFRWAFCYRRADAPRGWFVKRLAVAAVAALFALVMAAPAMTQGGTTAPIEVRVWQNVGDLEDIRISARPADGSWRTLGTIRLPLVETSDSGRYRYGDIDLDVPLDNQASPARVEVRVWQRIGANERVYISARPAGGDWGVLGTVRLLLDDGFSSSGTFHFGDISLDVPLPVTGVTTLAGQPGARGYRDGSADRALFGWRRHSFQLGLAFDRDGSVVLADEVNAAIRRIMPDGTVTTVAGGSGFGLRDGPAGTAQFTSPTDVAIAPDGSIYVADRDSHRIRKIAPDGTVSTVAGGGPINAHPYPEGSYGDHVDGPAAEARFRFPRAIALDPEGDLYIADGKGVRRLTPSGWVSTVVRQGNNFFDYRDGPAAQASVWEVVAIDVDDDGAVYLLDHTSYHLRGRVSAIRVIDPEGEVSTLFRGDTPGFGGALAYPVGLAVSGDGTVYVSSTFHNQIVALTNEGELRAVAGTGEQGYLDGGAGEARFSLPGAIAVADEGTLAVVDMGNNVIRRVDGAAHARGLAVVRGIDPPYLEGVGDVTILAGRGGLPYDLLDGPAREAVFRGPSGMALDASGNVIVADTRNHAIRSVARDGTVTTLAGGNGEGLLDGPCATAQFDSPEAVAVSPAGDIYVADTGSHRIRRISGDCEVTTVAGGGAEPRPGLRDGRAAFARFHQPVGLAFDGDGNLLIADLQNHRIRLLSPSGRASTFAGGERNDPFEFPVGVAVGPDGTVFVVERNALHMVDRTGRVSTVFEAPMRGEGGVLSTPEGIAVGPDGSVYVTESYFDRVLRFTREGEVWTVAGRPEPMWGVGDAEEAPAWDVKFFHTEGVLVDRNGDLLVSDGQEGVIWRIPLPE